MTSAKPNSTVREELVSRTHKWIRDCGLDVQDVEAFVDREVMPLLAAHDTALLERVDAELPDIKVGTKKVPLNNIERGYNVAAEDAHRAVAALSKELRGE